MSFVMKSSLHHLTHLEYRPDIDGLRAVAVLSVVGYHAFPKWVPGGFVGVDVFFVISGYLISTIIFGNIERDNFSYIEFYARRIKRIFPALILVLIASMVFGWYVLFSDEFRQLGKHAAAGAGFISNIALWSESGYFDVAAESKPLLHLWSLGVEEQFYILWPLLLGVMWTRKFNFLMTTLIVATISFIINIYWVNRDPTAGFFLPFSRTWELMVGGILAYISLHKPQYLSSNPRLLSLMSTVGLMMIGLSVILFTRNTAFPGWWALLPVMGAFLVIAGRPTSLVNRYFLSFRPVVWIGLISYPLYLWHWPILSYAQIIEGSEPGRNVRISAVIVSIVFAWGTYVFIEKRSKKAYSKTAISILSLLMALILTIGMIVWSGTLPSRHNSKFIDQIVETTLDWSWPGQLKLIVDDGSELYIKEGIKQKTLFFGDSHLQQYAPRIARILEENPNNNTAVFATGGGCPPIPNIFERKHHWCSKVRDAAIEYINHSDVKTVVVGGAWNAYFIGLTKDVAESDNKNYLYYYQKKGQEKRYFRGGNGAFFAMQELELFLEKISMNKKVFLLLDNPLGKKYSPRFYFEGTRLTEIHQIASLEKDARVVDSIDQQQLREKLIAIAQRTGVSIIDPKKYLCDSQGCKITSEKGKPIYKDGGHLRSSFVEQHATYMDITLQ